MFGDDRLFEKLVEAGEEIESDLDKNEVDEEQELQTHWYECSECGNKFDITGEEDVECPVCGHEEPSQYVDADESKTNEEEQEPFTKQEIEFRIGELQDRMGHLDPKDFDEELGYEEARDAAEEELEKLEAELADAPEEAELEVPESEPDRRKASAERWAEDVHPELSPSSKERYVADVDKQTVPTGQPEEIPVGYDIRGNEIKLDDAVGTDDGTRGVITAVWSDGSVDIEHAVGPGGPMSDTFDIKGHGVQKIDPWESKTNEAEEDIYVGATVTILHGGHKGEKGEILDFTLEGEEPDFEEEGGQVDVKLESGKTIYVPTFGVKVQESKTNEEENKVDTVSNDPSFERTVEKFSKQLKEAQLKEGDDFADKFTDAYLKEIESGVERDDAIRNALDIASDGAFARSDEEAQKRWVAMFSKFIETSEVPESKVEESNLEVAEKTFDAVEDIKGNGGEGIVCLGAGGDPQDWIDGVIDLWHEEGIFEGTAEEAFSEAFKLTSTGGRTDLVLVFNESASLDMGKIAMWRLRFGECSWISDFVDNYASHYGGEDFDPGLGDDEEDTFESRKSKFEHRVDEQLVPRSDDILYIAPAHFEDAWDLLKTSEGSNQAIQMFTFVSEEAAAAAGSKIADVIGGEFRGKEDPRVDPSAERSPRGTLEAKVDETLDKEGSLHIQYQDLTLKAQREVLDYFEASEPVDRDFVVAIVNPPEAKESID